MHLKHIAISLLFLAGLAAQAQVRVVKPEQAVFLGAASIGSWTTNRAAYIKNTGKSAVFVASITVTNNLAIGDGCTNQVLQPGDKCVLLLSIQPRYATGLAVGEVNVFLSDGTGLAFWAIGNGLGTM